MQRIIFATTNENKMKEIREILADFPVEILSLKEAGIQADIDENGSSFEENAAIKAEAIERMTGAIVLADDSGLEIDYLNGEPKDRDIAMVFQSYALYPHMSIYDNMAFGLKLRKMPKDEIDRRVREAARILDIEHLLDRKPKLLSGGQRQRVAMGRAIVREPKVFLMDEPLSNLDAKLRVQMRIEISKLHQRLQSTIIYVTHDQTEAMTLGTRIVVMKDGVIQQVDSPQNLYDRPDNLFVAGFIGSPQMNFIDATVVKEGGELFLEYGEHHRVILPPEKAAKLTDYIGKEVTFGIRPEDVFAADKYEAAHEHNTVEASVRVFEMLGAEVFLYLTVDGFDVTCREHPSTKAKPGDIMNISFDVNKIHVFDKETQMTITN